MADKRIVNLPEITDPTLNDEAHINDVISNFDKKVLLSTLRTLFSVPYLQVSLSNYDNDSAPAVKSGSSFDSKGVSVDITSDATPTGYGTISNSTTFYLYWDESASAFIYSATVPTWTDLYQGWYNGDDRALFSMFKDSGGTLYQNKRLLINQSSEQINDLNINDLVIQNSIVFPDFGSVGSLVIAGCTSWANSTQFLPGTTVAGSTLIYSTDTSTTAGNPLSASTGGALYINTGASQSAGLTGTWRLLNRINKGSTTSQVPVALFQRIS